LNEEDLNYNSLKGVWTLTPKRLLPIIAQALLASKNHLKNKHININLKNMYIFKNLNSKIFTMILKFYHDFTNLQFGRQKVKINYYFMGKNLVGKIQCLFDTFLLSTLEQGLETFIIRHMTPMGQNVINCNKLYIFLLLVIMDINLELVQDGKAWINNVYTFILHLY